MGLTDLLSGIGSKVSRAREKTRNYFSSKASEVPLNDDRGRNAQIGYKQREN